MTTAVCPTCKRPLPAVPAGGIASCPHCTAPAGVARVVARPPAKAPPPLATIVAAGGATPVAPPAPRPPAPEPAADPKRAQNFASALASNADRITPVRAFSLPPEAVPTATGGARKGRAAPSSTPAARAPVAQLSVAQPAPTAAPVQAAQPARAAASAAPSNLAPVPAAQPARAAASAAPSDFASAVAVAMAVVPSPAAAPSSFKEPPALSSETPSLAAEIGAAEVTVSGEPFLPHLRPASEADVDLRTGMASLLRRLPVRGLGLAGLSAVLVMGLGALGIKLFARPELMPPAATARVAVAPSGARAPAAAPPPAIPALVHGPDPAPPALEPPAPAEPAEPAVRRHPEEAAAATAERRAAAVKPPHERRAPAHEASHPAKARLAAKHAVRAASHPAARRRVAAHAVAASPPVDASASDADKIQRARESYQRGNEHLFSGDAAGAVTAYEEVVRLNPKDPAGYRGLGLAYAQQGRRTDAVRYLKAYLKRARDADDRDLILERISLLNTVK